jgi:hypothetical protein
MGRTVYTYFPTTSVFSGGYGTRMAGVVVGATMAGGGDGGGDGGFILDSAVT